MDGVGLREFEAMVDAPSCLDGTPLGGGLPDADRIDAIRQLERLRGAVAAAQARVTAAFAASQEAGQRRAGVPAAQVGRGVAAQLALARRISPHAAQRYVGWCRVVTTELPETFAQLAAGRTSEWRATLVARETAWLSRAHRAQADAELGPRLESFGDRRTANETRRLAYRLDPRGYVDRLRSAERDRHVSLRPAPDLMTRLTALLPLAHGVAVRAALAKAAETRRASGDPRTQAQVMADTLVERCTGQTTADAVPVEVQLIVPAENLVDPDANPDPAHLLGHGPVPTEVARELILGRPATTPTWLRRLFRSPAGELVAMESRRRTFTAAQRRFVLTRDQHCRTPWCDAQIRHVDHVRPHDDGGPTQLANAAGLCEACNHAKQAPGWRTRTTGGGRAPDIVVTTPTGHRYRSRAPVLTGHRPPATGPRDTPPPHDPAPLHAPGSTAAPYAGDVTLFEPAAGEPVAGGSGDPSAPLAARMRPRTLDEVVGQEHLLAPGSPLRRLVEGDAPMSLILFGPPGTGKTTLALIVSSATNRRFEQLSALNAGVKDVREVIARARADLGRTGRQTVLFIDEIHRFSKTQQDSLLGAVEARHVTLVAATTENPFFSVVSPLLSRSLLLTLQPLDEPAVGQLVDRALAAERGLAGAVTLDDDARAHLLRMSGGDARRALTALEAAAGTVLAEGRPTIDLATLEQAVDTAAVRYDRDGDQHYDVVSAFIKSIRGSDVDAALHYLARMIEAGEDPRFIARRLVVHASEDVGLADPGALLSAAAAAQAVQLIGMPEARINLAQATIHLATAPKSNAVVTAIDAALADVRAGKAGAVPPALRDGHYAGSAKLGHAGAAARPYRYPHDVAEGVLEQQYPPDELVGRDYYQPAGRGAERTLAERVAKLRAVIRGLSGTATR